MIDLDDWLRTPPYSLAHSEKTAALSAKLSDLTRSHYERCVPYRNILDAIGFDPQVDVPYDELPFLPVRLFKELDLVSVLRDDVVKTMTSSGTTGQAVSRIFLDKETSSSQMKVLSRLVSDVIGAQRLPMLVVDSPSVVKDRAMFSARGAGILGFSMFARERVFALDEQMQLDLPAVDAFLEKHRGQPVLVFGFTFMVWQHFYKELIARRHSIDLSTGVLIHGGGWKKLANEAVSSAGFRAGLREVSGLTRVHDYYGMVEQTGSIYFECAEGHLHASIYSDVIIRRGADFARADIGETGVIEVVSMLPASYPGHVLLTEDEGVLLGEDDCPCGRLGRYFKVLGRIKDAELRGCSDTYTAPRAVARRPVGAA